MREDRQTHIDPQTYRHATLYVQRSRAISLYENIHTHIEATAESGTQSDA